ncbi:MAG: DNA polymerase I [Alphaproteobacteria bacterium]
MPSASKSTAPSPDLGPDSHLYLVDGSAFIFRAFHALPPLTRKSDGLPVGAVSGFCNMLYKLLEDTKGEEAPSHFAVIFDHSSTSFRNDIYPDYKANRDEPPEDLRPQFALVRDATRAFNVACVEQEGYEADDLIATYAEQAAAAGARVTIVSSDKDLMQLVTDTVVMYDPMKSRVLGPEAVVEKFGVGPDKVVEVQALAGDSVDNIPGVPGIGPKTAAELIQTYGDVETLLARAEEIKQPKRRQNLIEFAEQARISRRLVVLERAVPVEQPVGSFAVAEPRAGDLIGFLKGMEFSTLTRRIAEALGVEDPGAIDAVAPASAPAGGCGGGAGKGDGTAPAKTVKAEQAAPGAVMDRSAIEGAIDPSAYLTITKAKDLEEWVARARDAGQVTVDTETTSLDAMQARLVGVALALGPGEACYVPLTHGLGEGLALEEAPEQIPFEQALDILKPLLEDTSVLKIGQNLKYDILVLKNAGIALAPFDDTMLLSYAADAGNHGHGMDELSGKYLGHTPIAFKEIAGSGKSMKTFDQIPIDQATPYAAEDADVTGRLHRLLKARVAAQKVTTVYETLERPLVPVLVDMEHAGIKVDRTILQRMSQTFARRMEELEARAHEQAGETFNLGSPKQLGEILFDKMGIAGGKKTKTGAHATGADILEQLAAEGHDLPATVLDWRQMSKLKSTYTDALPDFIHPDTGRIHTSYSMAATTTGRLSSSDPNLQNIPIRTKEGREIRTAFVAEKGHVLLSADYSQIELRVLAHVADIAALKQAFADGLDIHAMTASEMFDVPIEGMDPMVRRRAKAINFGIIYGISAFGLSNQLRIPRGEAQSYIDAYFERFPGIKTYMDRTKSFCRDHLYVTTLFGRRCHMPDIKSKQPARRSFIERAAINAPIQGTAADIIRRAMVRIPPALAQAGLSARMLLQVHDELIFEAPEAEAAQTCALVTEIMEGAALPAVDFAVPLKVEANTGQSWDEAH